MKTLEQKKHSIIDKILLVKDSDLLSEIDFLISSKSNQEPLQVNEPQIEMITMGINDIKSGQVLSEEELEDDDLQWLK